VTKSRITDIIIGVLGTLLIVASGLLFVRRNTPATDDGRHTRSAETPRG
jgi:hypothetical protein